MYSLFFLFSCSENVKSPYVGNNIIDTSTFVVDADGDGYMNDEDCDDTDSSVFPTAVEICDGVDNNCDGNVDEEVGIIIYPDNDGDGFGVDENPMTSCEVLSGYSITANDCDDSLETGDQTYPGAQERCDGLDNDCDMEIDEDLLSFWYLDEDGDGFGNVENIIEDCSPDENYVDNYEDCDDSDENISPQGVELCDEVDNDCDTEVDEGIDEELPDDEGEIWYADLDEDGFGSEDNFVRACNAPESYTENSMDCDDLDSLTNPNGVEYCDGIDNNCNGETDEDIAENAYTFYLDNDGDGFGNSLIYQYSCFPVEGHVLQDGDCDDERFESNPNADEYCNDIDDNCDTIIDEITSVDAINWYLDADEDGFGDPNALVIDCYQPENYITDNTDCDDNRFESNPNATEYCNGEDDNCTGGIDEPTSVDAILWHEDSDEDGFGNAQSPKLDCYQPTGYVENNTDCDDNRFESNPNATEYCNGEDDNCMDGIDEITSVDAITWYLDSDTDGFGDPSASTVSCVQPNGYLTNNEDCNDENNTIYPSAPEICDGLINTCGGTLPTNEIDDDEDNYVECIIDENGWDGSPTILGGEDCNSENNTIYPSAPEICDGLINTCGGTLPTNEIDDDEDNYVECIIDENGWDGSPTILGGNDCDDSNNTMYPSAPEICDGLINSCGVMLPSNEIDDDEDNYVECTIDENGWDGSPTILGGEDCDDNEVTVYPMAPEICNGVDDNCVDGIDEEDLVPKTTWYYDGDDDGYGTSAIEACTPPENYVTIGGDCNDSNAGISPGDPEVCANGTDENCNGSISESCPSQYVGCGGPGAMQPGASHSCSFSERWVTRIRVSSGCNDGESGNYTFNFNDGTSESISGSCNSERNITPRLVSSMTIRMTSGGGGDGNISFTCCGSSGWGVYYQ